jgi:hypothetical protein
MKSVDTLYWILAMQPEVDQTIYVNRILTHNAKQPTKENCPLSAEPSPGRQLTLSKAESEKIIQLSLIFQKSKQKPPNFQDLIPNRFPNFLLHIQVAFLKLPCTFLFYH